MNETHTHEEQLDLRMLNLLLTTPHGDLTEARKVHDEVLQHAPVLYGHFAVWYQKHGEIEDLQRLFVANLLTSRLPEHRDAGFMLLQKLQHHNVARVVRAIKGWVHERLASPRRAPKKLIKMKRRTRKANQPYFGGAISALGTVEKNVKYDDGTVHRLQYQRIREEVGPFRSVPRSTRTAVETYLRKLETNNDRFDSAALLGRKDLKYLYSALSIKPCERAFKILFENNPPEDSRVYALKELARAATPEEQAEIIVEARLPYKAITGSIREWTPTVWAAVINAMTPHEVINHQKMFKERKVDNLDLKALIDEKLEKAQTDKRVSALKSLTALDAVEVSEETRQQLEKIAERQLKARGTIKKHTGLIIDKSGSMDLAMEIGRRVGAMITEVIEEKVDCYEYLFDTIAYPLNVEGKGIVAQEKAMKNYSASGGTSCGIAIHEMRRVKQHVEQFILVTDEGENRSPYFVEEYTEYAEEMGVRPHVVLVRVPGSDCRDLLERQMREKRIPFDLYDLTQKGSDYYALPGLITFLTRPSQSELLAEIMEMPLPKRHNK